VIVTVGNLNVLHLAYENHRIGNWDCIGAGVCGGSVIGETDRFGGSVQSNRATPADVAATMFDAIGVDPHGTFTDNQGRVIQLTEGTPIRSWWSGK